MRCHHVAFIGFVDSREFLLKTVIAVDRRVKRMRSVLSSQQKELNVKPQQVFQRVIHSRQTVPPSSSLR